MAEVTADRVYETSTTTGTGSYTLAGAITGYRAFSAVCANGDTVRCFVEEVDASGVPNGGWEVGIYTWGTGGVLARTTIEASSNANAAVSWAAGTRRIGLGVTASRLVTLGATSFTASLATASPNNTNNASVMSASGGSTNQDAAMVPKGTGALLANAPDSTAAGGNKRGIYAVDWQLSRSNAAQVASGQYATIAGGLSNSAGGNYSFAAGRINDASGANSFCLGYANTSSGDSSGSIGAGGSATGIGSFTIGYSCTAGGNYGQATGFQSTTRNVIGAKAHSAGQFAGQGDSQYRDFVFRASTANATTTAVTADAGVVTGSNQINIGSSGATKFRADVVARRASNNDAASWSVVGLAKNVSGVISFVGTPTVTQDFADAGATGWVLAVATDGGNAAVTFNVTGVASVGIKWVVVARSVEVIG